MTERDEFTREQWLSLVTEGTLAASSHNSQPWRFVVGQRRLRILPDLSRRCPRTDPDDHHLYASLGCAAENVALAAASYAPRTEVAPSQGEIMIELELPHGGGRESPLAAAIPRRQCTRSAYEARQVPSSELGRLEQAATTERSSVLLITDPAGLEAVAEYVAEGNRLQAADRGWRNELIHWLRFNEREARRTSDGLWTRATGHPEVLTPLGWAFMKVGFSAEAQNRKEIPWIRQSAGVAVFVSAANDPAHWIEAGRCYERFALLATTLGIRNAFINQPVEVEKLRGQFGTWLGLGERRADLVVRFGYGAEIPRSLRRPAQAVSEPESGTDSASGGSLPRSPGA